MQFSWRDQYYPVNEWHNTLERAVADAIDADSDPDTIEYLFRDENSIHVITGQQQIKQYEIAELARLIGGT